MRNKNLQRHRSKTKPFYKIIWFWLFIIIFIALLFIINKAGYINKIKNKFETNTVQIVASPEYSRRVTIFEDMPVEDNNTIFLGDSIIAGYNWQEKIESTKYVNRGVSGARIEDIIANIDNLNINNPDTIVVLIGINNIASGEAIDDIMVKYINLVNLLDQKYKNTQIIITPVFHVNEDIYKSRNPSSTLTNKSIDQFNNKLKKQFKDKNIVDINKEISNNDNNLKNEYTYDGLHVTGEVYNIWLDKLPLK